MKTPPFSPRIVALILIGAIILVLGTTRTGGGHDRIPGAAAVPLAPAAP